MLENIEVLYHSCIKFKGKKIIYVDPFKIEGEYKDADFIFITHDHYDHFSEEDIQKVRNKYTIIIIPKSLLTEAIKLEFRQECIITVNPSETKMVEGIKFETISAYNINKAFHPKENNWVGYVIEIDKVKYYIAGDTDITAESKQVECDVAFVPVGGTYTMDFKEAAMLVNEIKPKIAVPIHYGSIVGQEKDATDFIKLLHPNIQGRLLLE